MYLVSWLPFRSLTYDEEKIERAEKSTVVLLSNVMLIGRFLFIPQNNTPACCTIPAGVTTLNCFASERGRCYPSELLLSPNCVYRFLLVLDLSIEAASSPRIDRWSMQTEIRKRNKGDKQLRQRSRLDTKQDDGGDENLSILPLLHLSSFLVSFEERNELLLFI